MLVDWAGTMTEPLRDVVIRAVTAAGMDEDELREAFAGLAAYLTSSDTPIHKAERGEIGDDELLAWMQESAPGARAVFDVTNPSSIFAAADRPQMVECLRQLRARGVRLVLATNNFASAQPLLATRYLESGLVDAIVNSALVGCRKPEPAFFERCVEVAGVSAANTLLLDDTPDNCEAAEQYGMTGIVVADDVTSALGELWSRVGEG